MWLPTGTEAKLVRSLALMSAMMVACCAPASGGSTASPASSVATSSPRDDTPRDDLTDMHPVRWSRYEMVGDDQVRVYYATGAPACYGVDVEVEEGDTRIVITILTGTIPGAPEACTQEARLGSLLVTLGGPVGEREITQP